MPHLTRYNMYKQIKECLIRNKLFPIKGDILGISGIANFYPYINKKKAIIEEVYYPSVDIQKLPYENNRFDYIITDQVLEHVEKPHRAIDESYRVLKKGGIAIHTTCFINYIHLSPEDFWRFSPHALSFLCRNFEEILDVGGWGNRIAILLCFLGNRFRNMRIPDKKRSIRHMIANHNEKEYPIVTWVIAKK